MKKNKKNNLDEMQEQKLLHLEHNGYWMAFWGLFASIYIQTAMGHGNPVYVGGECIVLIVMAVYMTVGCIRNGLWDRSLKPTLKTNVAISLAAGLAMGGFWGALSYRNYHSLSGSLATAAVMALGVFVVTLAILTLCVKLYQRKKRRLEQQADQEETEE